MLLDINPVRMERISEIKEDPFCFEDSIATFAQWLGRDYELMFMDSWNFNYLPPDQTNPLTIGERVSNKDKNDLHPLELYHGIKITFITSGSIEEDLYIIQQELIAERPLLLSADIFWCPWDRGYQKKHDNHTYLINGINDPDAAFYCIDSFSLLNNLSLSLRDFIKGRISLGLFTVFNEPVINPDSIINSINMTVANLIDGDTFDQMREFSDDISLKFDVRREMGGHTEYYNTVLWEKVNEIGLHRMRFALLLKYISQRFNLTGDFFKISLKFKESGIMWYTILNMIAKVFLTNNPNTNIIKRLADLIKGIADYEESLAYMLLKH